MLPYIYILSIPPHSNYSMKITQLLWSVCIVLVFFGCDSETATTQQPIDTTGYPYIMNDAGLVFDNNTKISVADADDLHFGDSSFTIMAWVKHNFNSYMQDIIVKGTTNADIDYQLFLHRTNQFTFVANGSQTVLIDSLSTLTTGRYYHVAAVVDRTKGMATIYVNGVPTVSKPILGAPHKVANRLLIGGHNTEDLPKDQNVQGTVYNVAFWKKAKTATEITDLMYKPLTGKEDGLVAYWPINDGIGSTVKDLGGKHNGTILGNARWVKMPY